MILILRSLMDSILKKIKIYYFLDYLKGFKDKYKFIDYKSNKKIFFMMTPSYGNLGDQAIEIATTKYLNDYFSDFQLIKVHLEDSYYEIPAIKSAITSDDLIVLQGGGNFGDLYYECEHARRYIIKKFQNNTIIFFPCTFTYTNSKRGRQEFLRSKKIYDKHKKIISMCRENYSYNFAQKKFNFLHCFLIPDIVTYLASEDDDSLDRKNILVCLRQDSESLLLNKRTELISDIFSKYRNAILIDTQVNRIINDTVRDVEVLSIINLFRTAKVIVTDRLHGLIFSVITNTPCLVFPSVDAKIIGTYTWIADLNYIKLFNNPVNICEEIEKLLHIDKSNPINFEHKYFSDLRKQMEDYMK